MALTWERSESYDIHILRNNQPSVDLEQFVRVLATVKVNFEGQDKEKGLFIRAKDLRTGVTQFGGFEAIAYIPSWVENNNFPATGIHEQNGIRVDGSIGKITAGPVPAGPPHTITSFGIRVVMFISTPTPHTVHPLILNILVHVHNNITSAWVTPSLFHVRPDIIRGIAQMGLSILSAEKIKKIKLFKNPDFTEPMEPDLLVGDEGFFPGPYTPNGEIILDSSRMLENRLFFKDSRVFYDPLHLEISYEGSARITKLTLPLHLWYLNKKDDVIKDESGNDLFKIVHMSEVFQYRPSLYMSFDDGTVGDVTFWHEVGWEPGPGVNAADIQFEISGAFRVFPSAVSKKLEVRAKLPPRLPFNAPAGISGSVQVDPSWLQTNLVAKPVPQSPVHPAADGPIDILFISEGFDDETKFTNTVRDLCKKIRDDSATTPWNYLFKSSINTWMLFEKSDERAASILYESVAIEQVEVLNKEKVDLALPLIELIGMGPKLSNNVLFFDFVAKVGVPVPGDVGKSKAEKITEWQALFGNTINSGDWVISNDVFDHWKKLAKKRALTEEKNTAFGLAAGSKPTLEPVRPAKIIFLNGQCRLDYQHIVQMLSRIRANDNTGDLIGEKFWGRDKDGKMGKDFGLIVFLADGMISNGTRLNKTYYPKGVVNAGIAVGMDNDNYVHLRFFVKNLDLNYLYYKWKNSTHAPAIELVPHDYTDPSVTAFALIAHELGHFFNLLDEYAEGGNTDAQNFFSTIYNLQHHDDLLENNQISGNKVKWRWPRISKAGVLAKDPEVDQPVAGQITVTLKAGHSSKFKKDEEIHLRQKDILKFPLDKLLSLKLTIVKVDGDKLILAPLAPAAFQWADFKQGSLAVKLTKASTRTEDNPTQDEFAEVMSSMTRKLINDIKKPLTKELCDIDRKSIQEPHKVPNALSDPSDHSKIIGLFPGGAEFSCKVYHPSGRCIMRSATGIKTTEIIDRATKKKTFEYNPSIRPFCHVCRYSLVDQIDPTKHGEIDKLYEDDYPDTSFFSRNKKLIIIIVVAVVVLSAGAIGLYCYYKDDKKPAEP